MKNKKFTNYLGLVVFILTGLVYIFTIEPTNSFWDCSEFISCAFKLEVGHAPGAPVFMLLGRFFSLFAGNDLTKVAVMINSLSAITSALTIVFLFQILVWFLRKLTTNKFEGLSLKTKELLVLGSAFIGAMSYAFTDSFWFSAVEGEVYATSSLFSAIVFWCIIKWEETKAEGWKQMRWIFLIFFLLGLSVGIHLLNVLALPAIALVYYSKRYKPSVRGIILSQLIALVILLLFIFGIIPGVAKFAAYNDLLFVNSFHLPVYFGALVSILLLVVALRFGYLYFVKKQIKTASIAIIAISFWLVGYSSFAVLVIRSNANPFIDINNVENVFGLVDYLNREQYPTRPLFKGNSYNSPVIDYQERYTYKLIDGKYYKDKLNPKYIFDEKTLTLFPRMASMAPEHKEYYEKWGDIKGRKVKVRNSTSGKIEDVVIPTIADNLRFFLRYQLGHMYFRYFMWNFAGRQNDIQGHGGILHGNWISGIPFLDSIRLGDVKLLPEKYKSHKSRNTYYLLPLLLGIAGMIYQYRNDKINFWVVFLLFFFTGIAIVLYLNEIPITPRERDYVYVGSFFAFAVWIGIGVLSIAQLLHRVLNKKLMVATLLTIIAILIPVNMLIENWNDHNRSGRSIAHDFALNTLNIMEPNAIFFTNGDNDTYPIWYIQEVENHRPDVRHILSTFLPIGWYANQLSQEQPGKIPINITYSGSDLLMSKNNFFPIVERLDSTIDLNEAISFATSSDKRTKVQLNNGELANYLPSRKLSFKVDRKNFIKSCDYVDETDINIPADIEFTLKNKYLSREELLLLDIISQNNWERPIYFMSPQTLNGLGLSEYLHREGNIYRLLPFKNVLPLEIDAKQALRQYNIVMEEFKWGNISDEQIFLDHTSLNITQTFRYHYIFAELAIQLERAGEHKKAVSLLNYCEQVLPVKNIGYSPFSPAIAQAYYILNEDSKGDELATGILETNSQLFDFFKAEKRKGGRINSSQEVDMAMYTVREIMNVVSTYSPELAETYAGKMQAYYKDLFAVR